jgi:hypothetical protein
MGQVEEYYFNRGLLFRYGDLGVSPEPRRDMPLYEIVIMEKGGWTAEVDGISVFADDKLSQMKENYKYVESKHGNAVVFPTLGVLAVGFGEWDGYEVDAQDKTVFLGDKETIRFYISTIEMWE